MGALAPAGAHASAIVTSYTQGLTPGANLADIALGPDGNLWFTESAAPGRIGRINPAGQITEFTAGLTANSQPTGITAGSDGNLWVTSGGDGVARVTPLGVLDLFTAGLTPGGAPAGIVAGAQDELWFAERDALARIDTAGRTTELGVPDALAPRRLAIGADGALWFVAGNAIGRLGFVADGQDPDGGAAGESSVVPVPRVGRSVVGGRFRTHGRDSVATVRGTTWLTQDRCDGTLTVVKSGAVSVRDRRTHRTVTVRAGGRHLARRAAR